MAQRTTPDGLVRVGDVAARFGLAVSTLHYWERRGLIDAAARVGGHRCYDDVQVRRIAVITAFRSSGMMSLDEIAVLLDRARDEPGWRSAVDARLTALRAQVQELQSATRYLEHLLTCPNDDPVAGCHHLQAELDERFPPHA